MKLVRVEKHIYTNSYIDFKLIDDLSFKSKSLYNYCNYILRQQYFNNKKLEKKDRTFISKYQLRKQLIAENQVDFRALPSHVSGNVIFQLFYNWKSFWKLTKVKNLNGKPSIPKFKHKTNGRNILVFDETTCKLRGGFINFQNKNCGINPIKTNVDNFQQVRIIPQTNCYVVEIVYKKECTKNEELNDSLYLGVDLGVNNLATLVINQELNPLLINGKVIKSVNQYYNKKKAKLMSFIGNKGTSNRIKRLEFRRNNKITDYLHKTSRFIINYCIKNNIKNIIIGKNDNWKQDTSLGKVNNQKFVYIPFVKLINQIVYKSEEVGIEVILTEESYTSKVDHLAFEEMKHQEQYKGKRIKRGLFQSSTGKLINSDVNGAIGIIRKVIGNDFINLFNIGLLLNPIRVQKFN